MFSEDQLFSTWPAEIREPFTLLAWQSLNASIALVSNFVISNRPRDEVRTTNWSVSIAEAFVPGNEDFTFYMLTNITAEIAEGTIGPPAWSSENASVFVDENNAYWEYKI